MLKLISIFCAVLLLASCSTSATQTPDAERASSARNYIFRITDNNPTSSSIYYVWPENQTWGSYSVFRVIEPIVDIDNYDEHVIDGTGPEGNGRYRMRVVLDQEQIEEYTWTYFLVSGMN